MQTATFKRRILTARIEYPISRPRRLAPASFFPSTEQQGAEHHHRMTNRFRSHRQHHLLEVTQRLLDKDILTTHHQRLLCRNSVSQLVLAEHQVRVGRKHGHHYHDPNHPCANHNLEDRGHLLVLQQIRYLKDTPVQGLQSLRKVSRVPEIPGIPARKLDIHLEME